MTVGTASCKTRYVTTTAPTSRSRADQLGDVGELRRHRRAGKLAVQDEIPAKGPPEFNKE